MQIHDVVTARAELKFTDSTAQPGYFSGIASPFGNLDSHDDVLVQGAFTDTLAERKAKGMKLPRMYFNHSAFLGGSRTPIGKWDSMAETKDGLVVEGHLIAIDHPDVKQVYDLMREGEADSLSIAFNPRPGGAIMGRTAGEPRRTLKSVDLYAVDVVCDGSNPLAKITSLKSMDRSVDLTAATASLEAAMQQVREALALGVNCKTADLFLRLDAVQSAHMAVHMALTGEPMPAQMKSAQTLREHEASVRLTHGVSHSDARYIAENGYKAWLSRDENRDLATAAAVAAATEVRKELRSSISDFSLPDFA